MVWGPKLGPDRGEVGNQPAGDLTAGGRAGVGAFRIPTLDGAPLDGADLVFLRRGQLGEKLRDQALKIG